MQFYQNAGTKNVQAANAVISERRLGCRKFDFERKTWLSVVFLFAPSADVSNAAPGAPGFLETSRELNTPMTDFAFSPAEERFLVSVNLHAARFPAPAYCPSGDCPVRVGPYAYVADSIKRHAISSVKSPSSKGFLLCIASFPRRNSR